MSALETTRRALLAGAAAVGSLDVLPYARKAEAEPVAADHPDAELIALAEQLAVAKAQRDTVDRQLDDAYDRHVRPEMPDALFWRPSDFMTVWIDRRRLAQYGEGSDARWAYEDQRGIDSLRETLAVREAADVANGGWGADREVTSRIEEIIAASEAWVSACRRAEDHDGITALRAASDRADQLVDDLEMRLVRTRARTTEGFAAKARAYMPEWCGDVHRLEHVILPALLAGDGDRDERWTISLLVDGMHLDDAMSDASEGDRA